MTRITIPNSLGEQFVGVVDQAELINESGQRLGIFVPAIRRAPGEPEDTLEELEAAANETGGSTLEEIWRELGVR